MQKVKFLGVGSFVPRRAIGNARIAAAIPGWTPARIDPREIDAIFFVTCSPDELNFSHDAMELHRRLGCREDCYAMVFDSGCGGTLYTIDMARRMIEGGSFRTIAVVASNFTSAHLNREVYTAEQQLASGKGANGFLSMYVFGDGAGAVILQG